MISLTALWLPILVASAIVFIASFIAWTVSPHHRGDWTKMAKEDEFLDALNTHEIPPGQYAFPRCTMADMKDPAIKERWQKGPHGVLQIWPGVPAMGRNMALTFFTMLCVSTLVAYIGRITLQPGDAYLHVFRVTGTAALLGYIFGGIPNDIWFGRTLRSIGMNVLDGLVYGLLTAGTFAWLWPAA